MSLIPLACVFRNFWRPQHCSPTNPGQLWKSAVRTVSLCSLGNSSLILFLFCLFKRFSVTARASSSPGAGQAVLTREGNSPYGLWIRNPEQEDRDAAPERLAALELERRMRASWDPTQLARSVLAAVPTEPELCCGVKAFDFHSRDQRCCGSPV